MAKQEWLFEQLFGHGQRDKTLPDPVERADMALIVAYFDNGVDFLRNPDTFPNPRVNEMMTLLWRLVGNDKVKTQMFGGVPSLHFWAEKAGKDKSARILIPPNYVQLCIEDPGMQLGALVYIGSQARDFYNDQFFFQTAIKHRSAAFEADALLTLGKIDTEFKPNDYQQQILGYFPMGLASLPSEFQYESRPFVPEDV